MKKFRTPKISTVIGEGTQVNGDLVFRGGLHLDGTVKGDISADEGQDVTLTVSEKGEVFGDVRVSHLVLNGRVVGDVFVTGRVELAPQAKVTGSLYYNLLEMAMGAEVNGQLIHTDGDLPETSSNQDDVPDLEEVRPEY